jgi:transposase
VLYGDDEHALIAHAAEIAGLRPSSYVASAALAMAEQIHRDEPPRTRADEPTRGDGRRQHAALTPHQDRELLAALIQARLALRRYAVNVNQIAAALDSGGQAPDWLSAVIAGADRAVVRLDRDCCRSGWHLVCGSRSTERMFAVPKKFPPEFKRDVVRVARRGDLSHAEVAADFDVSVESVRRWVRQADVDDGVVDGQTSSEQNELVQLRRDKRRLERRTRSCGAPRPTSPPAASQNELPAGP